MTWLNEMEIALNAALNPGALLLSPTAVKTANYTAVSGDFVPCDTTAGSFTVTLPNAPSDGSRVGVKQITRGGTNVVTVACAGSDVFNKTGGSTSATVTLSSQALNLQYQASTGVWFAISADLLLSELDLRYPADGSVTNAKMAAGAATANIGALGGVLAGTLPNPTMGHVLARQQLRNNAQGIIAERGDLERFASSSVTPTTQLANGCLIGLRAGDIVTGIMLRLKTAAAGTAPTKARFGIADSSGVMLAISGDLAAATNWTTGAALFPLAAPYTILTDGGYFLCMVVNGTWGSTQPQLANTSAALPNTTAAAALAGYAPTGFQWAAQTDLPAVAASLTLTTVDALALYMAAYGTPVA